MMTKAELAFSALDRDNKDNLVNINISAARNKYYYLEETSRGLGMDFVTRYCRAISLRKISRN